MTKKLVLRCNSNNETIHLEGDIVSVNNFVNWIVEFNHYTQRYPDSISGIDTFVFEKAIYLMACRKKAIRLNLLQEVKMS